MRRLIADVSRASLLFSFLTQEYWHDAGSASRRHKVICRQCLAHVEVTHHAPDAYFARFLYWVSRMQDAAPPAAHLAMTCFAGLMPLRH